MFKNHRKSLSQHCERSELHLRFEWTKVHQKCLKWLILKFWSLQSNSVTIQINFNTTKIGEKCQNPNETVWVIFKHCVFVLSELHLRFEWTKVHQKYPKWLILKFWNLQSNSVTIQINFNTTKIGEKCQNPNETVWVIFKHCVFVLVFHRAFAKSAYFP